jgi:DNA ligase (NAD+)
MKTANINELISRLKSADDAYYNSSEPIISDEEYDFLKDSLKQIDPENKYLLSIGAKARDSDWQKAAHHIPMTSLNKVNTEDELKKWARETGSQTFAVEEKLDGLSVNLEYEDSKLVRAITRGDGEVGDDIFENVRLMKGFSKTINGFTGSIRGEIILTNTNFEKLCKIQEFKNPRNAAVGIAKRFDHQYSEFLNVVCYDIESSDVEFETEKDKIDFLDKNGSRSVSSKFCTLDEAIKIYSEYIESKRADLDYDIDGLVIKINDIDEQRSLGLLGGNPKGQIAFKFPPMIKTAKVTDVEWQLGRSGKITPIIHIEQTKMGGTTISKMTCHNVDIFKKLKLYKGCNLRFKKANDVIPIPIEVVSENE